MKTKAYFRFQQRCDYYESDLELCELLIQRFLDLPDSTQKLAVALGSTNAQHPKLGQRNTLRSRQIRGGHLKRTLAASFVKDLYEDFVEYISEVMLRAAEKGVEPSRFVGDAKFELKASEILALGSWDNVVSLISKKVFRALEGERSTIELIRKAAGRLGLKLDQAIVEAAMPYLEARHLLVHQDGRADNNFRHKYPNIAVRDDKITLDRAFLSAAQSAIDALAREIDREIIAANLIRPEQLCR